MSSSPTEKLDIVVGKFPTDAMLCNIKGVRTLFMRESQTFTNAVENVRNVLPGITIEAAERMIREQCPEFRDLDELLGRTDPVPPSVEGPSTAWAVDVAKAQLPRSKRRRKVVLVAALLPALAASWALGRYTNVADTSPSTKASAPDATPNTAEFGAGAGKAPFTDPKFEWFSGSSEIDCDPINTLEAECTDADGMVMSTKAATGPDSTIFTFSYGSERIGLRIFYDAEYADTWARQDGSKELYPHMKVHDRYVLWGTDPGRIKEYADLLVDADKHKSAAPTAMGGATPLPPRLAALTLGTLGLNNHEVNQILARPVTSDAPTMLAARLVLGLVTAPVWFESGADDIVALAAGIEPHPPTTGTTEGSTPVVVPVSEPSAPTTSPSTPTGGGSTPTTTPSTDTKPSTPTTPTTPTAPTPPATTPPPETPSEPSTPPVADPAPSDPEPSTPQAAETPAPDDDPAPVEETPAPVEEDPAPVEETPAPVQTPAEGAAPVEEQEQAPPAQSTGQVGDDLLILDSAWTVAAAA
ncbi:hypothetical protein ACFWBB_30835 [Streptomyces sp. NPDC060000]|uniref:hypothetical protein n=1 Tax=Streptomyces sp. NPDC060000 TaxID=3347031 RepID=UPI0036B33252